MPSLPWALFDLNNQLILEFFRRRYQIVLVSRLCSIFDLLREFYYWPLVNIAEKNH